MTAIFGIVGKAERPELEAMARRMAHRGAAFEIWQPAAGVHLGICHRSHGSTPVASGLGVALDGVIENAAALGAAAATDRELVGQLYRQHGLEALARLRRGGASPRLQPVLPIELPDQLAVSRRSGAQSGRVLDHAVQRHAEAGGGSGAAMRAISRSCRGARPRPAAQILNATPRWAMRRAIASSSGPLGLAKAIPKIASHSSTLRGLARAIQDQVGSVTQPAGSHGPRMRPAARRAREGLANLWRDPRRSRRRWGPVRGSIHRTGGTSWQAKHSTTSHGRGGVVVPCGAPAVAPCATRAS